MHRRHLLQSLVLAAAGSTLGPRRGLLARGGRLAAGSGAANGAGRALRHSDVVFMYEASRGTYRAYGATVLAWGGTPTPASRAEASGISFYGSVGMVTEFARYHQRFPTRWADGLCRNVHGDPIKVPWLTDHAHEGEPFWWCCTRQPVFQEYLEQRVVETIRAGAHGVHVDDHLGSRWCAVPRRLFLPPMRRRVCCLRRRTGASGTPGSRHRRRGACRCRSGAARVARRGCAG